MEKHNRKVQYLAACSVSLASVTMGCYTAWPTPVMPKFQDNETALEISKDELSWMVAASSPGFMAGSLVTSFISDRFGRRTTVLTSVIPAIIGTLMVACALKAWWLYSTRFLWGWAYGMISTVTGIYFTEVSDKDLRGTLSLVTRFMFNFGNLLMMTIGPFVSYSTLNYMLLVLPVIYFAACWWIPESPYYFLKEGKVDGARRSLLMLRGYKDEKVLEVDLLQMKTDVKKEMRRSGSLKELFTSRRYRKALIVSIGIKAAQIMTGTIVVQQYLGLIMKESRTELSMATMFIIFGGVRFIVGIMSSVLADWVGRRPLLIYSFLGTTVSLAVVGAYFFFLEVLGYDREVLASYSWITFAGIIMSNIISTLGFNSLIVIVPAELFPLNVKALAMTFLSILGGFLNFGVARSYQVLKDCAGLCGVFWIFAAVSLFGTVFCLVLVPETKGKSLREIQMQLQGSLYNDDEPDKKGSSNGNEAENRELKELIKSEHKV